MHSKNINPHYTLEETHLKCALLSIWIAHLEIGLHRTLPIAYWRNPPVKLCTTWACQEVSTLHPNLGSSHKTNNYKCHIHLIINQTHINIHQCAILSSITQRTYPLIKHLLSHQRSASKSASQCIALIAPPAHKLHLQTVHLYKVAHQITPLKFLNISSFTSACYYTKKIGNAIAIHTTLTSSD